MSLTAATIIIILLFVLAAVGIYFSVRFGLVILKVQDSIEESLDVLDERYESISKILEIPLFYDSPEIRKVVGDIRQTRDAILVIANSIGASIDSDDEEEEEIVNEED
tara:strand:- start:280 stop:603 length:324 start_codon:yes stop_codon:yes gene_type:complete